MGRRFFLAGLVVLFSSCLLSSCLPPAPLCPPAFPSFRPPAFPLPLSASGRVLLVAACWGEPWLLPLRLHLWGRWACSGFGPTALLGAACTAPLTALPASACRARPAQAWGALCVRRCFHAPFAFPRRGCSAGQVHRTQASSSIKRIVVIVVVVVVIVIVQL